MSKDTTTARAEDIPDLVYTDTDSIPKVSASLRTTFASHKTKPVEWRLVQLRKLYWAIKDHAALITAACQQDLGKNPLETHMTEIGWCANDCIFAADHLQKWAKDESAPDVALMNKPLRPRIRKDPMGCCLIIGTYNFPFQLSLGPLIGAIAAGCTAILKPSETAPAAAVVVQKIVESALDPTAYAIVQGAVPETSKLLDEKWDKIFYTGGYNVAKIISKKAAETLTPVTLELGGRNPAIVTKNADMRLAARRLLWGKIFNAGQVCVSQNYTMIEEEMLPTFLTEFKTALANFYPDGPKASRDYGRIVSVKAFQRLKHMLDTSKGKILIGGTMDEAERFIEPTVIQVDSTDDALLVEESFGPLITILPVKDLDTAIRIANDVSVTPLGIYPFGNKKETDRILNETRSGGATVNDGFFHASVPTIPFGGVGESGQGSYRGRASFECFTHRRTVVETPGWMESLLAIRYPPYTGTKKLAQTKSMTDQTPNFDRDGKVKFSLIRYVLTLGGVSANQGLMRWVLVAMCMFVFFEVL
ncbi:MAG: hypothetical protein Q9162_004606 [Coniocarpon cinnabarinum]